LVGDTLAGATSFRSMAGEHCRLRCPAPSLPENMQTDDCDSPDSAGSVVAVAGCDPRLALSRMVYFTQTQQREILLSPTHSQQPAGLCALHQELPTAKPMRLSSAAYPPAHRIGPVMIPV